MKSNFGRMIIALWIVIIFASGLCSCSNATATSASSYDTSMFVMLESTPKWNVVYHKNTKVMYAVSSSGTGSGVFTVLLNPDGTPMIYRGNNESH
jgi:hypothetical protein